MLEGSVFQVPRLVDAVFDVCDLEAAGRLCKQEPIITAIVRIVVIVTIAIRVIRRSNSGTEITVIRILTVII